MSTQMQNNPPARTAWQERWRKPTLEQLLELLKPHQRRNFEVLMAFMDESSRLSRHITWFGTGWKWTINDQYRDEQGNEAQFLYLVPNVVQPLVCLPMTAAFIETVPLRRLSKFVREGIRSAKCAVDLHWATWTPGPESEANQLVDLLKRKLKFLERESDTDSATAEKAEGDGHQPPPEK